MRAWLLSLCLVGLVGLVPRPAHANFLPAPVQRAIQPVTRALGKQLLVGSARTHAAFDHAEAALRVDHPRLADAFSRSRRMLKPFSPVRIAGFAADRVRKNPMLVPAYFAVSLPIDAARMFAVATLSPAIGPALYLATSLPQTIVSLLTAEHATHALHGEKVSLRQTVKTLTSDYASYNARQDVKVERTLRALR